MDFKALYVQFCKEFWDYFLPLDLSRDRKGITFEQWKRRTPAARKAMHRWLEENGAPKKNPFFWVQDFPEPEPMNYNGSPDLNRMAENNEMVVALYNGTAGIYTKQDAEDYAMEIKRPFKL